MTRRARWPWSRAYWREARRPEYSAKLLVRMPRNSESSAMTWPELSVMWAPKPAGPGFPRAPPSQWAVMVSCEVSGKRVGLLGGMG